jgi:hypothetical protein
VFVTVLAFQVAERECRYSKIRLQAKQAAIQALEQPVMEPICRLLRQAKRAAGTRDLAGPALVTNSLCPGQAKA